MGVAEILFNATRFHGLAVGTGMALASISSLMYIVQHLVGFVSSWYILEGSKD